MRKFCILILFLLSSRLVLAQSSGCTSPITTYPYSEQFSGGAGGWSSGGTNSSWALGYPSGKMEINSTASDSNAWVTSLTNTYNANENSYVLSPCFNFTGLTAPVIEMKIWWNSEHNADGAVLQASTNGGLTWQKVGNEGDPYNWYNSHNISSGPGGQQLYPEGWTGRNGSSPGNGSGGWVTAKHKLNGLAGVSSVRLRIAFSSDPNYEDDGFAFDNVQIYDTPNHDTGVLAILSPTTGCSLGSQENVTVQVKNYGFLAQNNIPVSYRLGTNPPVTEIITTTIAPDDTLTYTFATKLNLATPNTYELIARTTLASDGIPANDSAAITVTSIPIISAYPYFQNFENGNGGWLASGTNSSWQLGLPIKSLLNSAASGSNSWVTSLTGNYNEDENSQVVGPCFNMSNLVSPLLTMKVWWNTEEGFDGAVLQASTNGGVTWQNVGAFGDPDNWYNHNNISSSPGGQTSTAQGWSGSASNIPPTGSNGWVTVKHLLTGLGGQPNVKLRIAFASDPSFLTDEGFAFDDVAIYENPANDVGITMINAPVSGTCGASTQENVTVTITNHGSLTQTSIPVSYQLGSNPIVSGIYTGSLASGASTTFTFPTKANLSAGGNFALTVSTALPADTFLSNNSRTDSISIFNPIAVFPHLEGFENAVAGDPGIFPVGWKLKTGTALFYPYSWRIHSGPTSFPGTGPLVDHTSGTALGKYLHAPASSTMSQPGDSTELVTPCFNISNLTNPGFSFWYHLAGSNINKLEIQISANNGASWTNLFTLTGGQQTAKTDAWRKKIINLAGFTGNVKLKFKAYLGNGPAGDIALDDLKFFNLSPTDLEIYTIQIPATDCGLTATETICTTIMNTGSASQSNFPVSYRINSGIIVSEVFTGTIPSGGTANYCFNTKANLSLPGNYSVSVSVNAAGDADTTNNNLTGATDKLPVISTLPYTQDFENGNGGWIAQGRNSSWALGLPNKTIINSAASGTKSWVTNLTGQYNAHENSYVMGPCFNFSTLTGDPDIEMKAWWNAHTGNDGAVLQTSVDGGLSWQNVGDFGDPVNWYNDSLIYAQPGGQTNFVARGWTGTMADIGSKGWVTVKHKLDGMAGKPSVQLRIAFASDSWKQDDGFAFDDIKITDNTNNLALNSFIPLSTYCGYGTNEKVEVELENLGSTPIANVQMQFKVNGGNMISANFAGPLAGGAKTYFIFPAGANLTSSGINQIIVIGNAANDPNHVNDTLKYSINNPLFNSLPVSFDFENPATGLQALQLKTNLRSAIADGSGASYGTGSKGIIMDGVQDSAWTVPTGLVDPWATNPENFAGAYFCISTAGLNPADSLHLTFDLKQLFKTANANTNLRVTVNGTQVGPTYRPPFSGTPISWQKIKADLTPFKNQANIQIGLESSVMAEYNNGTGTANLIDNIKLERIAAQNTGIQENVLQNSITVYPNPSNGLFYLNIPATTRSFFLEVTDLTGKTLKQQLVTDNSGTFKLNLNERSKGIYILKLTSEGQTTMRKLIVE